MNVKICGVCRPQDAAAAAAARADFLGVILAPGHRRTQNPQSAAAIFAQAHGLKRVGVFVDPAPDHVAQLAADLQLDVIQLHGSEDPVVIASIAALTGCNVWKTVWLSRASSVQDAIERYGESAHGLLLDARQGGTIGGTGVRFDWQLAAHARARLPARLQLIVAGGLTADNVHAAVAALQPDVVDVSTGVESSIGQKSEAAIAAFVRNARI